MLSALVCCVLFALEAAAVDRSVYMDPSHSVDERTAALLAQMTNAEKQAQTIHLTGCSDADFKEYAGTGLGACPGGFSNAQQMESQNARQLGMINTSRLGIPITFHSETLHSSHGGGTVFPMPSLQGATWSPQLVERIAATIALEARAAGIDRGFSPELNVCTDPRFGRVEENFGEDPNLVAAMGVAAVKGLHGGAGGGPSTYLPTDTAIVSEAKHAAAYGFGGKDGMAADLSTRTLHDVYLKPWKRYAEAGGRGAMMAHNSINDEPCHSSAALMDTLRSFGKMETGLLASDMCDVGLLGKTAKRQTGGFGVATDLRESAAQANAAGLDQELCNPTDNRGQAFVHLAELVNQKTLAQRHLDRGASNVLRSKFASGLFDTPVQQNASKLALLDCDEHRALAREAVHEGAVLLHNDGTLPLQLRPNSTVALVGPLSGCLSSYASHGALCEAQLSMAGGYSNMGAKVVTMLEAATAGGLPKGVKLVHAAGLSSVASSSKKDFESAISAALQADVVIAVVGDSGNEGWVQTSCGEDEDRTMFDPPGLQLQLLKALVDTGKPVVAVLVHGRPVTFDAASGNSLLGTNNNTGLAAVLATWRPGEEGGPAIWDLLTGRTNPSGRLSQAWPRSAGFVHSQTSPWFSKRQGDFDQVPYARDGPGARTKPWSPLFPFGFGLSYSKFELSNASITSGSKTGNTAVVRLVEAANTTVVIGLTVQNTGGVAGKTVVGVYHSKQLSRFVRYHQMLATWQKTDLIAAGAKQTITMEIGVFDALSVYDTSRMRQSVELGEYWLVLAQDSAGASTPQPRHKLVLNMV